MDIPVCDSKNRVRIIVPGASRRMVSAALREARPAPLGARATPTVDREEATR